MVTRFIEKVELLIRCYYSTGSFIPVTDKKKSGQKLVYKLKLHYLNYQRNMEGRINGNFLNNTGEVLAIQFYHNGNHEET